MPSRARDRQLAKQHARRQAAKRTQDRRKKVLAGAIGAAIGVLAIFIGWTIVFGDDDPATSASPSVSASPSATVSPEPVGKGLPSKTGEVTPEVAPPSTVACGGQVPDAAGQPKPQFDAAPNPKKVIDAKRDYVATIETSCGTIELELFADVAPQTVANLAFLADQGFYDGLTFHRIVEGFVIQGGDPVGTGIGGPGYAFADEIDPKVVFDTPGQLAMANSGPGTNGSQWFMTLGGDEAAGHLNGKHTIFGQVTGGMDVVEAIAQLPVNEEGMPDEAVYIESVIVTKAG